MLLPGTELIGRATGSGLREPPSLVRRSDGQIIQLSQLLYVLAGFMDGRGVCAIADAATERLQLRVAPEHVSHAAEQKLAPLGLVADRDGRVAPLERRSALLALRWRTGIVPERAVGAIAALLRPLFHPALVIAALIALVALDAWLVRARAFAPSLRAVIRHPTLALVLFGVLILTLLVHECGHATACRYGGARPGRIGFGIYLVWPAFFSDVTDSWRLSRGGRLRTDLGGMYFNVLCAVAAGGAYLATGARPLVLVVVSQQLIILDQFAPWLRLDGYYVVSDLIGVPDLFARIRPVLAGLRPGRPLDPRVTELKPWARGAVTAWVLTTVTVLTGVAVAVAIDGPAYVSQAWQSLWLQLGSARGALTAGNATQLISGVIGTVMLVLPVAGLTVTYVLACRGFGGTLALRLHARRGRRALR